MFLVKIASEGTSLTLKKKDFLCLELSPFTQNWAPVNVRNTQAEENFFIFKVFETSRWEKSGSNLPDWSTLLKFGQNMS